LLHLPAIRFRFLHLPAICFMNSISISLSKIKTTSKQESD
jgi:hypothetical protein